MYMKEKELRVLARCPRVVRTNVKLTSGVVTWRVTWQVCERHMWRVIRITRKLRAEKLHRTSSF